jgi:hypothetical protein
MVAAGWTVRSVSTTDDHINVGRELLTGGLAFLFGGIRTPGAIALLFERRD